MAIVRLGGLGKLKNLTTSSLKQVGLNFGSSRRPVSGAQVGLVMKQT
jgi:hypothetical protein